MIHIPDDVAKRYAAVIRQPIEWPEGMSREALADLLDPQPPTLREQVAAHICQAVKDASGLTHDAPEWDAGYADAVLAVVADWLAAQPVVPNCGSAVDGDGCFVKDQRDHDVRLLRGVERPIPPGPPDPPPPPPGRMGP